MSTKKSPFCVFVNRFGNSLVGLYEVVGLAISSVFAGLGTLLTCGIAAKALGNVIKLRAAGVADRFTQAFGKHKAGMFGGGHTKAQLQKMAAANQKHPKMVEAVDKAITKLDNKYRVNQGQI